MQLRLRMLTTCKEGEGEDINEGSKTNLNFTLISRQFDVRPNFI